MLRFRHSPLATPVALALATLALVFATSAWSSPATSPRAHAAATCADYPNQAAAQRAADTRDPDGDGLYCEDLPCPCAGPGQPEAAPAPAAARPLQPQLHERPRRPADLLLQDQVPAHPPPLPRRAPPRLAAHAGLNRRRRRAPRPAARGHPDPRRLRPRRVPAGGRARQGKGLERGRNPRGWKADVRYVPARRTAPTARRSASSCGASATARASATSSGSGAGGKCASGCKVGT